MEPLRLNERFTLYHGENFDFPPTSTNGLNKEKVFSILLSYGIGSNYEF
jgi:hypothetical protein